LAEHVFLAIEGVIGVGKTTLARLLQPRFNAELLLEAFDQNPFLSAFYSDRERYAFQTQIFFLLSRFRQRQAAGPLLEKGSLIADYIFAKDSLFAHLNLKGDELTVYEHLYEVLASRVVPPHLVIYLRASPDVLMARIAQRDRSYERAMERRYIEQLWDAYERYFGAYVETPLLAVDTDALDFVRRPADLDVLERQIRARLALGVYQPALPLAEPTPVATPRPGQPSPLLTVPAPETAAWPQVAAEFAAAREALERVGAALGIQTSVSGSVRPVGAQAQQAVSALPEALREVLIRVQRLAEALGLDLGEGHGSW